MVRPDSAQEAAAGTEEENRASGGNAETARPCLKPEAKPVPQVLLLTEETVRVVKVIHPEHSLG